MSRNEPRHVGDASGRKDGGQEEQQTEKREGGERVGGGKRKEVRRVEGSNPPGRLCYCGLGRGGGANSEW